MLPRIDTMANNYERMIQLVTEFFDVKNDPEQLDVDEAVIAHLHELHPATLSEVATEDGPIVWILVIPTLHRVMERFISGGISEKGLVDETPVGVAYDAIYLCSASVLPEYRHKGLAKKTTIEAINAIRDDNPVKSLFYWPFSEEGRKLAEAVAAAAELPLFERG